MADYTDKIDALLSRATELGFTEQDFAELAIAAADQAGADADQQHEIEIVLGLALDECANCGGSTAPGSPDPHECAPAPHHCVGCDRDDKPTQPYDVAFTSGATERCHYCDDCADLARMNYNGETQSIVPAADTRS